ncbi:endo alpha-1,4 polygalactosaminidase [Rheinheimera sp.]|uniref:endo alpha-1,4 polygalactosaminidase n=1 Tax=Rheinheimera sp. TaxID=1869214 RepID=UPI0040488D0A
MPLPGVGSNLAVAAQGQSIAFYYQPVDSVRELLSYDRVVVSPAGITPRQLTQLQTAGVQVFAYLSVGEAIAPVRPELRQAILAENSSWQSLVMDLQQPGWQQHLVDSSQQLINRGFDGLFLDTLDSYMLAPQAMQSAQRDALANLINRLAAISPALILNRGFDILPALDAKPTAVVAESLYYGFDAQSRRYISQTEADVNWLKQRLKSVQQQGIEAIVLDYLPDNTPERVAAAKRILADGFTPYIADGLLTEAGVSLHYPVKRRVLGLYDSRQGPKKQSRCHRNLAMLVEYAGYVPDCQDINQLDGAAFSLHNYAGALLMLPDAYYQQPQVIALLQRMLGTVPTVFIGALPADADLQQRLGITQDGYYRGKIQSSLPVLFPLPMAGEEQYPRYVSTSDSHQLIASYSDSNAKQGAAIIKATWAERF